VRPQRNNNITFDFAGKNTTGKGEKERERKNFAVKNEIFILFSKR
jgi:hypothetical protein